MDPNSATRGIANGCLITFVALCLLGTILILGAVFNLWSLP